DQKAEGRKQKAVGIVRSDCLLPSAFCLLPPGRCSPGPVRVVLPAAPYRAPVAVPIVRRVHLHGTPVAVQAGLEVLVPLPVGAAVVSPRAIPEPARGLDLLVVRLVGGRDRLAARSLLDRIAHMLIQVGLITAKV